MHAESTATSRLSLARILEFAAVFSGITLIAGYIWMHLVAGILDVPVSVFTISDYATHGVSTSVILSAFSLLGTLLNALTFPGEEPRGKLLKILLWVLAGGIFTAFVVGVFFYFYVGSSNSITALVIGTVASMVRLTVTAGLFLWAIKMGAIRASLETISLVVALSIWVTSATDAMAYATKARNPLSPHAADLIYRFEGANLKMSEWYPLLSTERFYYFVRRSDGETKVLSSSSLKTVSKDGV
ncbi:hypothetical protein U8P76_23605 [Rhizobium johnstonii]|nr:hypothetical protein U8P76_23605 [Rhizobium johnstonii]